MGSRCALFLLAAVGAAASSQYTVTDLGALGGKGAGWGINDAGVVVGWAIGPDGNWAATGSNGFSVPDAQAYSINNSGQIAGVGHFADGAHGMIWNGPGTMDLGVNSYALSINDAGQVAGGNGQAFRYSNGVLTRLGILPGGDWSSGYGINSQGEVVGYSAIPGGFRGFSQMPGGSLTPLGTLGGYMSYAMALNDLGQIVGTSSMQTGYLHAFLDSGGKLQDLGTLGGTLSAAYSINNSGQVVGYSYLPGSAGSHAFLYQNGVLLDLNALIGGTVGWDLSEAFGINQSGQIAGDGIFNGQYHAFRLDPVSSVPEPGSLPLLGLGLALLAISRVARHPKN